VPAHGAAAVSDVVVRLRGDAALEHRAVQIDASADDARDALDVQARQHLGHGDARFHALSVLLVRVEIDVEDGAERQLRRVWQRRARCARGQLDILVGPAAARQPRQRALAEWCDLGVPEYI
jgi:hypothetical protein